jgi:type I restriction enzyme R subunit
MPTSRCKSSKSTAEGRTRLVSGGVTEGAYVLAAEARARSEIDRQLDAAGWVVQSLGQHNVNAAPGVAIREVTLEKSHGRADYLLFAHGRACGVIEAKPVGTTLTEVERQSAKYTTGMPSWMPAWASPLPFAYESTGVETRFTCGMDPQPRSRRVFTFHRPETLAEWCRREDHGENPITLTDGFELLPPSAPGGLWPAQETAIRNLEGSLQQFRPRALIQMATGSGKTFTAANISYRLIKHAGARRILFLVDRGNLGRQTLKEFQQFVTPDDGRKFTELYNVQHLSGPTVDPAARVTISTIQRLYSTLRGEELPAELDETTGFEVEPGRPVEVAYSARLPIETFDVIIIDECHRSIYGVWRQVLEYFDAYLIGLTATPSKFTFGFFDQNLVMEYGHEQAVADNVNVDFDVYRIRTKITEQGSVVEAGTPTQFRDRETRAVRLEVADEDLSYTGTQLGTDVFAKDQIRTVIRTFKERLFTEIFPGRREVPKTLIFAKTDSHADDIVQIVREEFGKGNDFAEKITYRSSPGKKPEDLLAAFRNSYNPRVAVTVDMIATGTDVKPLECVFFMRTVKSRNYFEQMKGRGVRVVNPTDLQAVTPDATVKDHFVIVDAVGATETELSETQPLDREPSVSFDKLISRLRMGDRTDNTISSIAGRLARLSKRLDDADRADIEEVAGTSMTSLVSQLVQALDPDRRIEAAQEATGIHDPDGEAIAAAARDLISDAVAPLVSNERLMQLLVETKSKMDQLIDEVSRDEVLSAGHSADATDRARKTVESFRQYLEDHKDELTALQILYNRPYALREVTYRDIRDLAHAIERTHPSWTTERLWEAYEALDKSKVRGRPEKVLTNLVSLVRFALATQDELVPYPDQVNERFAGWVLQQEQVGRMFTSEQQTWLGRIRDHLATSLHITIDDLMEVGFTEHGGIGRATQLFGSDLHVLLSELEQELVA